MWIPHGIKKKSGSNQLISRKEVVFQFFFNSVRNRFSLKNQRSLVIHLNIIVFMHDFVIPVQNRILILIIYLRYRCVIANILYQEMIYCNYIVFISWNDDK
jgi:hypothetical protein